MKKEINNAVSKELQITVSKVNLINTQVTG